MKHYAMARKKVFEAAAVKPTGTMPEGASVPSENSEADTEADTEADVKQKAKQTATDRNGPEEHAKKKSPPNVGSLPLPPPAVILGQSGLVGDAGSEHSAETREIIRLAEQGDALSDAIRADASLRTLVLLWSALDESIRQAILTIAQNAIGTEG